MNGYTGASQITMVTAWLLLLLIASHQIIVDSQSTTGDDDGPVCDAGHEQLGQLKNIVKTLQDNQQQLIRQHQTLTNRLSRLCR